MANLLKLVMVFIRLSQSIKDTKSKCLVGSFVLLSRNCSTDRTKVTRSDSWKPDAHGVLSRSTRSMEAAVRYRCIRAASCSHCSIAIQESVIVYSAVMCCLLKSFACSLDARRIFSHLSLSRLTCVRTTTACSD